MNLRIVLIGTGTIVRKHLERINNNLHGGRVVAVADDNAEFGKAIAKE